MEFVPEEKLLHFHNIIKTLSIKIQFFFKILQFNLNIKYDVIILSLWRKDLNGNCIFFRLTGKEKRCGGFDLIWDDGAVLADDGNMECSANGAVTTPNSFLGR